MCLAIYCPAGCTVPEEIVYNGLVANPDGAGYAVQTGASLRVRRFDASVTPGQFLESWLASQRANPAGNAILHFRWATAGDISRAMSHPFRVGRFAVAHNGHISGLRLRAGESDTAAFVRTIAPAILHSGRNFSRKVAARSLEVSAGAGNKLLALPVFGPAIIAGESAGFWEEGLWYSNDSGHYSPLAWPGESTGRGLDTWGYPTLDTIESSYTPANFGRATMWEK